MKRILLATTALLLVLCLAAYASAETVKVTLRTSGTSAAVVPEAGSGALETGNDAPFRAYNKKDKYQYVVFGQYPQTAEGEVYPVLWRVLNVQEDGLAFLLAEYVLDAHQVIEETDPRVKENHTYRKITTIEESDLYPWMNTVMANTMFTVEEQAVLDDSRGIVFLPTDQEYLTPAFGFSSGRYEEQPSRKCNCTDYAKARGVYREGNCSTYWANYVKAANDHKLQLVGVNGHLSYGGYTRENVGIRPAILVRIDQVGFASGEGTRNNPYVLGIRTAQ